MGVARGSPTSRHGFVRAKPTKLAPVSWIPDSLGCRAQNRESTCRIPSRPILRSSGLRPSASPTNQVIRSARSPRTSGSPTSNCGARCSRPRSSRMTHRASCPTNAFVRLRHENRIRRTEREILEKAAALFARERQRRSWASQTSTPDPERNTPSSHSNVNSRWPGAGGQGRPDGNRIAADDPWHTHQSCPAARLTRTTPTLASAVNRSGNPAQRSARRHVMRPQ